MRWCAFMVYCIGVLLACVVAAGKANFDVDAMHTGAVVTAGLTTAALPTVDCPTLLVVAIQSSRASSAAAQGI